MLYDGDCGFCARWIERWKRKTGGAVAYEPYQAALARFPKVTEAACREAVQLIMPDGTVHQAAHAVLHALALAGRGRVLLWAYERLPPFAWLAEAAYQWVAHHRMWLSRSSTTTCRVPHPPSR